MQARPSSIDLNSDLGEGFGRWSLGDDEVMLALVSSANVACGFHAGDPSIMRRVCRVAAERGVAVGAHVSYRDLEGFGRREIPTAPDELIDGIAYQIGALAAIARAAGTRVSYVKPHGALYNVAARSADVADTVATAVKVVDPGLPILGLPGSQSFAAAERHGLTAVGEAFADRAYTPAGLLVPRTEAGAVLHDPNVIAARCVQLATTGTVTASDGSTISVAAQSICVHGDTPGAVVIAAAVRAALEAAGVTIAPFVSPTD